MGRTTKKETPQNTVKLCVYCRKNPVPFLGNGLQSTWIDNCNECSKLSLGRPLKRRGIRRGQKIHRHKSYRVFVLGGIDEQSGNEKVLFNEEYKQYDRQAVKVAKQKLQELGGLYAIVILQDRSTDTQIVVARFEWQSVMRVSNFTVPHTLKEKIGD